MKESLKICATCIICLVLAIILKVASKDMAILFKICAAVLLAGICISSLSDIVGYITHTLSDSGISEYAELIIKAMCISVMTHVCAIMCKDAGEESIAYFAELYGGIQIMILALPVIDDIFSVARELLEFV